MSDKSAGQWVGGIIGAVIGFFAGGPYGAFIGASIGAGLGGWIDPPKGPTIYGPRLQDSTVQTSSFGAPLPRIYGTVAVYGNVIWLENNQLRETVRKKKQGGKGGGGGATVKTYSYYATFAVSLGDAPPEGIAGIRRVWTGSDLIYNSGSDDLGTIIASDQVNGVLFRVYPGSDDQMPDPRIEAEMGVGNAPAFRGTAYIVFYDLPLEKYGNSLMGAQVKVELVVNDSATGPCTPVSSWTVALPGYADDEDRASTHLAGGIIHNFENDGYVHKYRLDGTHVGRVLATTPSGYNSRWRCVNNAYLHLVEDENTGQLFVISHLDPLYSIGPLIDPNGDPAVAQSGGGGGLLIDLQDGRVCIGCLDYSATDGCLLIYDEDGKVADLLLDAGITHLSSGCYEDGLIYVWQYNVSLQKYDAADLTLLNEWDVPNPTHSARGAPSMAVVGEYAYLKVEEPGGPTHVYRLSDGGVFEQLCDVAENGGAVSLGSGLVVINQRDPARFYRPGLQQGSGVALDQVVESELLRTGLIREADIDVADLALDTVRGCRLAGVQQVRACIAPLQAAYPFDIIMSGYQIKAVRRGKSSVVTIPIELLDARPYGEAAGAQFEQAREMDSQLPRQLILRHLDAEREYDINEQRSAERMSTQSVDVREIELPLVLTPDEGAQVVDVLFTAAWLQRIPSSFRLPPIYGGLEPADVITIDAPYGQFELQLTEVNYLPDGRMECSARPNSAAAYSSVAVGGQGVIPDGTIGVASDPETVLLDIPLIRNDDDEPLFAAAMATTATSWPGGVLFRSPDNGQTWADVQAWATPVTMGTARDTLTANEGVVIDRASALQVDLFTGELESITEAQMMLGINWAAYGADGRWELMRFADAVLQSDGSYVVSTLLRGLRGTEWATGLHQEGDYFVLLDDPDVMPIGADLSGLNVVRQWRGVSAGQTVDDGQTIDFAYRGVNLRPLSPVHPAGYRSSGNWVIEWTRRTRLQGSLWKTGIELPLGEATEAYEVDIISGSTVVRTLTATTQTVTYTQAQQIEDFGTTQSAVTVRIYQMSASIGRGLPCEATFVAESVFWTAQTEPTHVIINGTSVRLTAGSAHTAGPNAGSSDLDYTAFTRASIAFRKTIVGAWYDDDFTDSNYSIAFMLENTSATVVYRTGSSSYGQLNTTGNNDYVAVDYREIYTRVPRIRYWIGGAMTVRNMTLINAGSAAEDTGGVTLEQVVERISSDTLRVRIMAGSTIRWEDTFTNVSIASLDGGLGCVCLHYHRFNGSAGANYVDTTQTFVTVG